jgi:hypothetical protein
LFLLQGKASLFASNCGTVPLVFVCVIQTNQTNSRS